MNFHREIAPDAYLGTFQQSTEDGERLGRVLSLVDKLYRPDKDGKRAINVDQWLAAGTLRNMIMMEMGSSQGVMRASSTEDKGSAFDGAGGGGNPTTKADRLGTMHTGFKIEASGEIRYVGGKRSRSNEWTLLEALEAAVGKGNRKHAEILIRVVIETEAMPTLTQLTLEMTDYYGAKSKQTPPFALGVISTWLYRLHLHFKETGRA